ncbi:MAG: TSUP family transporter [Gemmataceae bacterium]|nr:TSUP family transporter [Gemmataceae bacterium]
MSILLYLVIGLGIGLVSGALGIGGGVLLLPALMWLGRLDQRSAAGTTLAVLVVPVVLPAVWHYYEAGYLDLKVAGWVAAGFAVGGYLGAFLTVNHYLPDAALRLLFGLLMLYIAVRLIVHADSEVVNAGAGLAAVVFAWLGFLALRALGRRHLSRPSLRDKIREAEQQDRGGPDYYI